MVVRRKEQASRIAAQKTRSKRRSFKPVTGTVQPTPVTAPKNDTLSGNSTGNSTGKPAQVNPTSAKPDVLVASPAQQAPKKPTAEVVRKNRDILQAQAVGKQLVKNLQSKGKLGAKDAKDMIQILTLPAPGKNAAANFVEWRAALNNARTRITALVQSNALSADEGRAMYQLFEQRAKDAISWQESGGVTQIKPAANTVGALKARKVNGKVAGKVKPVGGKASTAGTDKEAAAKLAHDQQRIEDARARKQAHDEQRVLDARAAKQEHDRQRIEAARAKLAEKQAQEQAAKKRKQAAIRAAKEAQISKQGSKTAPKGKTPSRAKPTSGVKKPKGSGVKPQVKKPGVGASGPAGKTPSKVLEKPSPAKKGGK